MQRTAYLLYGVIAYAIFFLTFLYLIGFVGGVFVPKGVDGAAAQTAAAEPGEPARSGVAWAVNLGLITLFGVQHSVMARPWFKRRWTKVVPWPIERSTFVLITSLILILMFWQWRPMPQHVWIIEAPAWRALVWALFALGWAVVLLATFLIDHFELFGLKQVWTHYKGRELGRHQFRTPFLYKFTRHPLYFGFLLAFWAAPDMSVGRLVFALGFSAYIITALAFEERDLAHYFGDQYRAYMARVSMLIPLPPRK